MKNNNWIGSGMLLGTVFFLAVLFIKPIGVSTQFSVLSGIIHNSVDAGVISKDDTRKSGYVSTNAYYDKSEGSMAKSIKNPLNYDFVFVLAIPLGAAIGYAIRKKKDQDLGAKNQSSQTVEKIPAKDYMLSFLGGLILLYGARLADGCTSGHMISGMMQGAVSGYVFTFVVFATAVPVAVFRNKKSA